MATLLFATIWTLALGVLVFRARRAGSWPLALLGGTLWSEAEPYPVLPVLDQALLWLAHAGSLIYLWRLSGRSYAAAILLGLVTAALLLLPQAPRLWQRRPPCEPEYGACGHPLASQPHGSLICEPESASQPHGSLIDVTLFSALFLPYLVALLGMLRLLPAGWLLAWLWPAELAAVGYILLLQAERCWGLRSLAVVPAAALLLFFATAGWAALEYFGRCTHGVTGSDPYCYAQMAVDVARYGDPRHLFTLFPLVGRLQIPWWPIVHVGYHVPADIAGKVATVWPVGWPALLGLGYRLFGEGALYLGAPVAGVLSLVAMAALAGEVWPAGWGRRERWLAVALAVAILATSREQVLWLLVPMADVPAQLFTVVAVWLALRAGRRGSWPLAVLAGAALGMAYDIRHTQVFLAFVLALALVWQEGTTRPWRLLLAAGAGACLLAAPDLWYHHAVFGGAFRPESPELNLIGFSYWWGNARRMAGAMAAAAEFGLLLPFLAYGAWRLWRMRHSGAAVLIAWVLINAGTQFLYGPLRWRDLLSILPPFAILAAYGITDVLGRLRSQAGLSGVAAHGELSPQAGSRSRNGSHVVRLGRWAPGWLALGVAFLLVARSAPVLAWPWQGEAEMTFGYLTREQRQAFDLLAQTVESDAVVGTSLNSGAVELYTGRQTFRPGDWAPAELEVFLAAMAGAGKPVYILDDGNEHAAVVQRLAGEGHLEPVQTFQVPLYGDRARLTGTLYRVKAMPGGG